MRQDYYTLNLTNAQSETAYGIFTSFTDDGVDTQIDKIENTVITLENRPNPTVSSPIPTTH